MKRVSKAGDVDLGDRVTPPVKFSCKPELTLTTLSPCKQALSTNEVLVNRFSADYRGSK